MAPRRLVQKRAGKIGMPPGTLVHVGARPETAPHCRVMRYNAQQCEEAITDDFAAVRAAVGTESVTWLTLNGLHQVALLESIGTAFDLHPLVLEDILNTDHRPKLEFYDGFLFVVAKLLAFDPERNEIVSEQLSLVLGPGFVLAFQERTDTLFDELRTRIRADKGRARRMGADYLAYRLLDTIIDHYFLVLEQISDHIELLEEGLVTHPDRLLLQRIHQAKREMILLRRSVWPLREVIGSLQRDETGLVSGSVQPFLRDLYDHTMQVIDTVETFRDLISGMLDLYLSSVSNRMNEIMKVLTIMSTLFIPLTFLVGVYGMNFDNLPELHWQWGYFVLWGVMLVSAGGMLIFFRRKGWL